MAMNVISTQRGCRRLRAKGMFLDIERGPEDDWLPSMSDGFVWCTHTHNCLGPDGSVASEDACVAGRDCFEA